MVSESGCNFQLITFLSIKLNGHVMYYKNVIKFVIIII